MWGLSSCCKLWLQGASLEAHVALLMQFDITFPGLPCEWISLDAMDISGEMHLDVVRFFTNHHV